MVAGGVGGPSSFSIKTVEIYDPATGVWTPAASMFNARSSHAAVLLPSGNVLVAGGSGSFPAELYNPATNTWASTGNMHEFRFGVTGTLLPDGKVLVPGGGEFGSPFKSCEVYNPTTNVWRLTGDLHTARYNYTTTLLPDGKVLIAGGTTGNAALATAELYDPATGVWTETGSLNNARTDHAATLLPNGQVLVTGGSSLVTSELYDPASGTWSLTGSLNQARSSLTTTLLPDGSVLAAGGKFGGGVDWLASCELYGSAVSLPSNIRGRGTFDNAGNPVTFQFQASRSNDTYIGNLSICDAAAGVCTKKGRVSSLTITGNTAVFSGFVQLQGQRVNFDASVTDNGAGGTSDSFSIAMTNGYSASGTLTSGDILFY